MGKRGAYSERVPYRVIAMIRRRASESSEELRSLAVKLQEQIDTLCDQDIASLAQLSESLAEATFAMVSSSGEYVTESWDWPRH